MPNEELNKTLQGIIDSINELYAKTSQLAKNNARVAESVSKLADIVGKSCTDIYMIEKNLGLIKRTKGENEK